MELTPKQQAVELIRQAEKILLVTGREPNNDQLASVVALQLALTKLGKQAQAIISDKLPKAASVLKTDPVATDLTGARDFIVSLDLKNVEVDKLKYNIDGGKLNVVVTPHKGNFEARDASFDYGAVQFDLVLALGVPNFSRLDRLIDANPTIFDGLHVINVDYHRINDNWGSVNLIDPLASSTAEMLLGLIESLDQGLIDTDVSTALLTGIMAATNRFTGRDTTPKAMTVAAQLLAGGARQQDVVRALYEDNGRKPEPTHTRDEVKKKTFKHEQNQNPSLAQPTNQKMRQAMTEALQQSNQSQPNLPANPTQPKSLMPFTSPAKAQDRGADASIKPADHGLEQNVSEEIAQIQTFDSSRQTQPAGR